MNPVLPDLLDAHIRVFDRRNLRRMDWVLLLFTGALAGIGLLNMYSATYGASSVVGPGEAGRSMARLLAEVLAGHFGRQVLYFLAGVLVVVILVCVDYRFLAGLAPVLYGGVVALLVAVLFVGHEARGGQRWIDLGLFRLQPSEFAKVAVVYMLAWYIARLGPRIRKFRYFTLAFLIAAGPVLLIFLQPSLSAALVLFPIAGVMVFAAGCRLRHIGVLFLVAMVGAALVALQVWSYMRLGKEEYEKRAYPFQLKAYQIERILTFFDPERDPREEGYHALQAKITVGSGQLTGKGFCQGTQTHLNFLPEYRTDFIFALLAEEWGFVGAITVLGLFWAFLARAVALAKDCSDPAGSLLAVGSATIIGFHAFGNVAVTLGLLPVTGMPLPFLSYGGSFYMTTMICVGTLLAIHVRRRFFETIPSLTL